MMIGRGGNGLEGNKGLVRIWNDRNHSIIIFDSSAFTYLLVECKILGSKHFKKFIQDTLVYPSTAYDKVFCGCLMVRMILLLTFISNSKNKRHRMWSFEHADLG
jgi:hypothetical protein